MPEAWWPSQLGQYWEMLRRDTSQEAANRAIDAVVNDPGAPGLVAAYYAAEGPFAGSTFDLVGDNPQDRLGPADLLAVTLLDVMPPPPAVRRILYGDSDLLAGLLEAVPASVELWEASQPDLEVAGTLWEHLRTYPGVDWVTAGKLLARKRPRLIPVIDSVIVAAVPAADHGYWEAFRSALQDPERRRRIQALRGEVDTRISDLRILDVAIWMRHSRGRNATGARAETNF